MQLPRGALLSGRLDHHIRRRESVGKAQECAGRGGGGGGACAQGWCGAVTRPRSWGRGACCLTEPSPTWLLRLLPSFIFSTHYGLDGSSAQANQQPPKSPGQAGPPPDSQAKGSRLGRRGQSTPARGQPSRSSRALAYLARRAPTAKDRVTGVARKCGQFKGERDRARPAVRHPACRN